MIFKTFITCLLIWNLFAKSVYKITKSYVGDSAFEPLLMGNLIILEAGNTHQAYVQPVFTNFIDKHDFQHSSTILLTFFEEHTKKTYRTSVVQTLKQPHGQKIDLLMDSKGQILSINYIQTRIVEDIRAQIYNQEQGKKHTFVIGKQPQKKEEEESFFTKYKWPLIIGGILLYLSMSMDPQKLQQGGQAAQGAQ